MATISEVNTKLQAFVSNLDANINTAIMAVEPELVSLNQRQMLRSKGGDDKPLIHSRTGSPNLSKAYAKRMGKTKPNIYVNGAFQKEMFLQVDENKKQYFTSSWHRLVEFLPDNYKNLFGIAPSNQTKAKNLTTKSLGKMLKEQVFK